MLWNAPDDPAGATVTGYTISRRVKPADGEWGEWDDAWASISADDLLRTYYTDTAEPEEGEMRAYRVLATSARGDSDWSEMAYAPTMPGMHNMAPTAGAAIVDQTVTAGATVMVKSTITDADTDDTLTWSVTSNMPMYATATVDSMGMVTIMGVAAGMATITVTATDAAGAYVMQTIAVRVEAADTTLGNAMGLTATAGSAGDVDLTWTPGTNATIHWIAGVRVINGAIDPSFTPIWHAAGGHGTHTVNAPTAGDYVFAVIAGRTSGGTTEWSRWMTQRYTHQ